MSISSLLLSLPKLTCKNLSSHVRVSNYSTKQQQQHYACCSPFPSFNNRLLKIRLKHSSCLKPPNSFSVMYGPSLQKATKLAAVSAANEGQDSQDYADYVEESEESYIPESFKIKEVPEPPVRWPWFVALALLVYARHAVVWELSNWKKLLFALPHVVPRFVNFISQYILAFIYHFAGDLITGTIFLLEELLYNARSTYFSIVSAAPVHELSVILLLSSVILTLAETVVPDSVNSQPYLLSFAGLIGFLAVRGSISEVGFWISLVGVFCFSSFIKKKDVLSASVPVASVLVAVGEPWIRAAVILSFGAFAVTQRSKLVQTEEDVKSTEPKPPLPMFLAALAIGIHLAARWTRYRHLTWMIA